MLNNSDPLAPFRETPFPSTATIEALLIDYNGLSMRVVVVFDPFKGLRRRYCNYSGDKFTVEARGARKALSKTLQVRTTQHVI